MRSQRGYNDCGITVSVDQCMTIAVRTNYFTNLLTHYEFNTYLYLCIESSAGSSPGQNLAPAPSAKVRRANSCPEMKKNYSGTIHPPDQIGKALDESDELNMDLPLTSTVGQV